MNKQWLLFLYQILLLRYYSNRVFQEWGNRDSEGYKKRLQTQLECSGLQNFCCFQFACDTQQSGHYSEPPKSKQKHYLRSVPLLMSVNEISQLSESKVQWQDTYLACTRLLLVYSTATCQNLCKSHVCFACKVSNIYVKYLQQLKVLKN